MAISANNHVDFNNHNDDNSHNNCNCNFIYCICAV